MALTRVIIGNTGGAGIAIFPEIINSITGWMLCFSDVDGMDFCSPEWIEEEFEENGSGSASQFMLGILHLAGFQNLQIAELSTIQSSSEDGTDD
jgi:hypothetical protein